MKIAGNEVCIDRIRLNRHLVSAIAVAATVDSHISPVLRFKNAFPNHKPCIVKAVSLAPNQEHPGNSAKRTQIKPDNGNQAKEDQIRLNQAKSG